MDELVVTYYYWPTCPYCRDFNSDWKKLQNEFAKEVKNKEIIFNEIDDSKNRSMSVPTIYIGKDKFNENRTIDNLKKAISEKLGKSGQPGGSYDDFIEKNRMPQQCGGRKLDDDYFRVKYLKYKAKYMRLKSKMVL